MADVPPPTEPLAKEDERTRRYERGILIILVAVQFISIVDFMVIMPLGPQLMRTMTMSPMEFGIVVSAYTIAAGVAGLVGSMIIDRMSRKRAFLGLYSGFLVGTFLCGLAPTYPFLVAARVLTGMFGGILGGVAQAIIGDVFPEARRGRAMGALMTAFALASIAGVPLGISLGTHYTWHATFLILGACGMAILPIAFRTLPTLQDHITAHPLVDPMTNLRRTFSDTGHQLAFGLTSTLMISSFTIVPFLSTYVVANVGMTEASLPWLYIIGGGCTLLSSPIIGRIADKHGKLKVFQILVPASSAIMLSVTVIPRGGIALSIITGACLMVANSGRMIAAMAMITSSVTPARRGGFMSANASIQHLSAGIGAFIAGHVITRAENGELEHYPVVGVIGAIATLLSLWFAVRLRPAAANAQHNTAVSLAGSALTAAAEASYNAGEPLSDVVAISETLPKKES